MPKQSAPKVRFDSGVFVVELGEDFSHLQEHVIDELKIIPLLSKSIEPACLVIDMTNVKFIGSAAIGLLVDASKTLTDRGGSFGLLNANQYCQTVISMAKLDSILPNCDPSGHEMFTPTLEA